MDTETESPSEIWELYGDGYRLPVMVAFNGTINGESRWAKECVRVSIPRIPILAKQRALIDATLARLATRKVKESVWILRQESLSTWFRRSTFKDPQDVVVWNWVEPEIESKDGFVTAYCRYPGSVLKNEIEARLAWASFCRFALHWMLKVGKPLDLGFGSITALPLRGNWLSILAPRYERAKIWPKFSKKKFIHKFLKNGTLSSYDFDRHAIRWSLAITSEQPFHEATTRIEIERKKKSQNYGGAVQKFLKDSASRALEVFDAHRAEATYPVLKFPRRWGRGVKPEDILSEAPINIHGGDGVVGVLEAGGQTHVASTDSSLQQVPDLQQAFAHVRDAGRDVDESSDGTDGGIGMRLLAPDKKQTAGELLDLSENGRRNGLAGQPQLVSDQ